MILFPFFPELPIEFLRPLQNVEVIVHQTAVFECEIQKPDQPAQWFQAGGEIIDWDRFTPEVLGTVHRLTITDAEMEDEQKYSCVIKTKKTSAKLTVKGN